MTTILVAEDDGVLRERCCAALSDCGYGAFGVGDGAKALETVRRRRVDLLVTDIGLPGLDGLGLVRTLRAEGRRLPVLMLSARGELRDKYAGFCAGADDYMVKPVLLPEVVWRVTALLRRTQIFPERRIVVGGAELDRDTLTLCAGAYRQELTHKEFRLLFKLAANAGRIVTRPQLMDDAWGPDAETEEHSLDVHISRLRRRLQNTGLSIVTVRGLGYKIVPQDGSARP